MKTKDILLQTMLIMTFVLLYACREEGRLDQIDDTAPAPAAVTVKEIINREGGAIIKYNIPDDKNLLGVKAVYDRNGEICETKASIYVDSLIVEGYADTQNHTVKIYSVGRNTKLSQAVEITVKPLIPPVRAVEIDMTASFGGVNVFFNENRTNAALSLVLLVDSTGTGNWEQLQIFYAKSFSGRFARRGLPNRESRFALFVRDKWNNYSDTLVKSLSPLEEEKIPKDRFRNARLPGDTWEAVEANNPGYAIDKLWDGLESSSPGGSGWGFIFATPFTSPMPQHFTIDLGRRVLISRFKMWPRDWEIYEGSCPRTFQLWGTDAPPPDGSWNNWQLLGEWEMFKPSGYESNGAVGVVTAEDRAYLFSGGDYEVTDFPEITHLRFRTLSTFNSHGTSASAGQIIISELSFWGQLKD